MMGEKLYQQVATLLEQQIEQGTYVAGDRLPGLRQLRQHFGVSMATMVTACEVLEQRGILEARPRSGFYVCGQSDSVPLLEEPCDALEGPSLVTGQERVLELVQSHNDPSILSLGAAAPPAECLPVAALDRSFARVRRTRRDGVSAYDFPPGNLELRTQIAQRMGYAGCTVGPDDIVLTQGCQDALTLSLRAVGSPGDVVAIESPTFYGILQAIESLGMRALEITTDPVEGMSPQALERALDTWPIRACVMMPSFGNPLGHLASDERKQRLVNLLAEHEVPLIEDDVYGELCFKGPRPWAAKAWDARGNVLYCGSFSKTLGAGLRVGWVAPGRYRERVTYLKYATSQATAPLETLAVADYLERGGYERYLGRARRYYQRQVRRVTDAVLHHFPRGTQVTRPQGGFVIWVVLPEGHDSLELQRQALAAGMSIAPGPYFSPSGRYRRCLRLSCALPQSVDVETALSRLFKNSR